MYMTDEYKKYPYIEEVTVAQLYQEELDILVDQWKHLKDKNTKESLKSAESIVHVINYFRARLGQLETEMEQLYGADPKETLH